MPVLPQLVMEVGQIDLPHAIEVGAWIGLVMAIATFLQAKAWGKRVLYAQLDRPENDAYALACEAMTASSQTDGAREGMAAFLGKRHPRWTD